MLRRLLADLLRWLVERWASGQHAQAKREEEWDEQADDFEDAAKRWRRR